MKNFKLLATLITLTGLFASHANAEIIFGAKVGVLNPDIPAVDSGSNLNLQIGYEFLDAAVVDFAIEAEVSSAQSDSSLGNQDFSFDSQGLYLSLRTIGPVYVIARAGYVKAEMGPIPSLGRPNATDDSNSSMGVGIGFSTGVRWELEYTTYSIEEIDFDMITFGIAF